MLNLKIKKNKKNLIIEKELIIGRDGNIPISKPLKWEIPIEKIKNNDVETYVKLVDITSKQKPEALYYYLCFQKETFSTKNIESYKKYHLVSEERQRADKFKQYLINNYC